MNYLVYIDNQLVDLSPKTVIAITIKMFDIGEIQTRNVSYTNSIKLPPTENNHRALGYSNNTKSKTTKPYEILPAKILIYGSWIQSINKCVIERFEGDYIVTFYDDGIDILSLIGGKLITELGHIPNGGWLAPQIDTARTATTGATAPVLNWGKFNGTTIDVNADFYLPSYFYHEIVKAIIEAAGYGYSGSIFSDTQLTDLVVPFGQSEYNYSKKYSEERRFEADNTSAQVITNILTEHVLVADNEISDPMGWYDDTNSRYVIPDFSSSGFIGKITLRAVITVTFSGTINTGVDSVDFRIVKTNTEFSTSSVVENLIYVVNSNPVTQVITLEYMGDILDTDYFDIRIAPITASGMNVSIDNFVFTGNVTGEPNANFYFHNYLLPDIDQADFFKDFAVRFGLLFKFRNGVMYAKSVEEIINDKANAVDWTSKRALTVEKIDFESEYASLNTFTYDQDDGVIEGLGSGSFELTSAIESEKNIFDSQFLNTESGPVSPNALIVMANIPIYDSGSSTISDFIREPGFRVLTLRSRNSGEPSVLFDVTARTDYKVAYFVDLDQQKDTGFQYFIDNNYSSLKLSLDRSKIVERDYNLSPIDVSNIDIFLPIYDNGEYFIINEVKEYVQGQITTVELLKIV